jgi:hypothetical protein
MESALLQRSNEREIWETVVFLVGLPATTTIRGDVQESIHISLPDSVQLGGGSGHYVIRFAQEPHQGAIVWGRNDGLLIRIGPCNLWSCRASNLRHAKGAL